MSMDTLSASVRSHDLARHLAMSWAARDQFPEPNHWTVEAIKFLTRTADALGFDLVKRVTAQEAHEAMIAARLAEDPISDTERDLKQARANEDAWEAGR